MYTPEEQQVIDKIQKQIKDQLNPYLKIQMKKLQEILLTQMIVNKT